MKKYSLGIQAFSKLIEQDFLIVTDKQLPFLRLLYCSKKCNFEKKYMISKDDILLFLQAEKEQLFTDYQLVKLGLFGSFARNEATENSDIDLIIEFESETENLSEKKAQIKRLISQQFNRKVDLCREKYLKPYFKSQILQSVIYV